jgi:hypothetical protein
MNEKGRGQCLQHSYGRLHLDVWQLLVVIATPPQIRLFISEPFLYIATAYFHNKGSISAERLTIHSQRMC